MAVDAKIGNKKASFSAKVNSASPSLKAGGAVLNPESGKDGSTGMSKKAKNILKCAVAAVAAVVIGVVVWASMGQVSNNAKDGIISDQSNTIADKDQDLKEFINSASNEASAATTAATSAIEAAQKARDAANNAYDMADKATTLEEALDAYKAAVGYDDKIAAYAGYDAETTTPAVKQASDAKSELKSVKSTIESALNLFDKISDDKMDEELKTQKAALQALLQDNSAVPMTLEETGEETQTNLSVVDGISISENAETVSTNAASIALAKVMEFAEEAIQLNEVTFNETDIANLATYIKGAKTGTVESFLNSKLAENQLTLFFGGLNGKREEVVYELSIDVSESKYIRGEDNADKFNAEVADMIKNQKPASKVYVQTENLMDKEAFETVKGTALKFSAINAEGKEENVTLDNVRFSIERVYNKKANKTKITVFALVGYDRVDSFTLEINGEISEATAREVAMNKFMDRNRTQTQENVTYAFQVPAFLDDEQE